MKALRIQYLNVFEWRWRIITIIIRIRGIPFKHKEHCSLSQWMETNRHKRKSKIKVLAVLKMLLVHLSFLPVSMQAAIKPLHERFALKPTCISTIRHSHLSVLFWDAVRPLVRSKTSRFMPESTRKRDHIRVFMVVVRASGQREICKTTIVATLGISKCNIKID